jgi:phosphate transport system protein
MRMTRVFDEELQQVKDRLLTLGGLAEQMIGESISALVEREPGLIQAVYEHEEKADQLCVEIDDQSFKLLALRQPVASDMRFLVAGIKMNADLERIADLAVNIVHVAADIIAQPPLKPLIDIPRMAGRVQEMVRQCLEAFVARNADLAVSIIEADDEVDRLRDQIFRELLTYMMSEPATIPRALDLLLVSRNLERMGDHATNIAEDVVYLVRGEDIRERGDKEIRKGLRHHGEGREMRPWPLLASGSPGTSHEEFLGLLRDAADNAAAAARALQEMVGTPANLRDGWKRLEELEHRGDELTHDMHRRLNRTFITPISRPNLEALISGIDNVVDTIEAAASRMVLYGIQEPSDEVRRLTDLILVATELLAKTVHGLPGLEHVEEACVEINRLENAADDLFRGAVAALFDSDRSPTDVLKWKEIYELLEAVTDRCEDVANVIETIALRHA